MNYYNKNDLMNTLVERGLSEGKRGADVRITSRKRAGKFTPPTVPGGKVWMMTEDQINDIIRELFLPGGSGEWHYVPKKD